MSVQSSAGASRIDQLKVHLRTEGYAASVQRYYPPLAQRFFDYLKSKRLAVEAVRVPDLEDFLRWELRAFHKRHGRGPRRFDRWRWRYLHAVHMVLRLVHGRWPIAAAPTTAREVFHCEVVSGYDKWMEELRGLAPVTRSKRTQQALQFLTVLGPRGDQEALTQLNVCDIDAYVQQRCVGVRRASIEGHTVCLRAFLRYLHNSGRIPSDLSATVIGPRIYEDEQIPAALRPEEVRKVLEVAREDRSRRGRRDYAFLMLLATYGLRAGEIVALRLEDIDWRKQILRVRHSKSGAYSELPLLHEPGEAVLGYLQKVRPASAHREIFLHLHAPYGPFKRGSILHCVTRARLKAAGITPLGRRGPHAFRHARAVSLLCGDVSLKTIGDVLGHKSARSTAVYLKLATEGLRDIGLDLPSGVSP